MDDKGMATVTGHINLRRFTLDPTADYQTMLETLGRQHGMPYVFEIEPEELGRNMCGAYDDLTQVICINDALTDVQKRCTLVHELFHWLHGHAGCVGVQGVKDENRVRRETALFLIDPVNCAIAEREHDSDLFGMSSELDVTVQVLEDYRQTLDGLKLRAPIKLDSLSAI